MPRRYTGTHVHAIMRGITCTVLPDKGNIHGFSHWGCKVYLIWRLRSDVRLSWQYMEFSSVQFYFLIELEHQ